MTEKLTRRAALGAIASLPAAGAVTVASAGERATTPTAAVSRVHELARELAAELDDWCDGQFMAEIFPKSKREYAIGYQSVDWFNEVHFGVSRELRQAIEDHKAAHEELENACNPADSAWCKQNGVKHTRAAKRRWNRASRAEMAALMAVCETRTRNWTEHTTKGRYLFWYSQRMQLEPEHTTAILRSMIV